jgi:hypothetical protein
VTIIDPYDADEAWAEAIQTWRPADTGVRHGYAKDPEGRLVCCGRTAGQIGHDWQTSDPERVNCTPGANQ